MNNKIIFFVALFVIAACTGCGDQVGLSGKVVFSDDGSPVTFGTVCFSTPSFQAKGEIKQDGTFTMGSYSAADGLPPGTYKVCILGFTEDLGGSSVYSFLDEKWTNPSTTDYTVEVQKTTKNLVIKVDRNPTPKPGGNKI